MLLEHIATTDHCERAHDAKAIVFATSNVFECRVPCCMSDQLLLLFTVRGMDERSHDQVFNSFEELVSGSSMAIFCMLNQAMTCTNDAVTHGHALSTFDFPRP